MCPEFKSEVICKSMFCTKEKEVLKKDVCSMTDILKADCYMSGYFTSVSKCDCLIDSNFT